MFAGGSFIKINGVAQKSLVKLRLRDGARITAFKGRTNARVKDDGSKLLAIGNWTYVAGLRRDQIVMLDLATSPLTVSSWATTRYQQQCSTSFATYMRDVDVSPDGSWFVVATTGAYRAGSLCDTAARWEIGATGPGQQPT